jgi:S-adenosylmethionine hydrolase
MKIGASLHSVQWVASYSEVEPGETLIHVDSAGLIAVAVRDGAADEELNLRAGVAVSLVGTRSKATG